MDKALFDFDEEIDNLSDVEEWYKLHHATNVNNTD